MSNFIHHVSKHVSLCLSICIIILSFTIPLIFPVYFRADDTLYLEWVSNHNNPLSSFLPSEALIGGVLRPMQNFSWWLLFYLFGLNAFPYQVFTTLCYGFSFLFYYKIIELVFSKRMAILSILIYLAVFNYLLYIIFWFGDIVYTLEMFFMTLSIYLLFRAIKQKSSIIWGIITYVLAVMSKEPSSMIVPTVVGFYLLSEWKNLTGRQRNRILAVVGGLLGFALVYVLGNPHLHGRQGISFSSGIPQIISFLTYRWNFYAKYLVSGLGPVVWITTLFLALKSLTPSHEQHSSRWGYFALGLSATLCIILRFFPSLALFILLIAFVPIVIRRHKESFAIAWFALPLLGIMSITFFIRTLLVEASFGITIVAAVGLSNIFLHFSEGWRKLPVRIPRIAMSISLIVVCLAVLLFGSSIVKKHYKALSVVSATRLNLKDAVNFIDKELVEPQIHLYVLDYEDMGLDYRKDILALSYLQKASRQKTMTSEDMRRLLNVMGKQNITVESISHFLNDPEQNEGYLLVMNKYEQNFVNSLNLKKQKVYKTERCGEVALLYHLRR